MFSVKTLVITAVLAFGSLTPALATPISINVHGVSIPGDNSAIDIGELFTTDSRHGIHPCN